MSRKHYFALCALVMTGAFAGGFIANRTTTVAYAQDRIGPTNLRATSFTLVNQQGQVEGTLRGGTMGAELELDDASGNSRVVIGVNGITIRDAKGRPVWSSPKCSACLVPATPE
jgi:hypothetical protein